MANVRISDQDIPPCGCGSPGQSDAMNCYCGVEDLLRVIRRRYSLSVMNAIQVRSPARFHEIASALPQASSSTLAETLHALDVARLVVRRDLSADAGPHTLYTLTPSGAKLLERLRRLLQEVQSP